MSDIRIDQAVRIANEQATIRALEVDIHQDAISRPKITYTAAKLIKTFNFHFIETSSRQIFLESTMRDAKDDVIFHASYFGDGTKYWTVEYQPNRPEVQKRVTIGSSFAFEVNRGGTKRPQPISYLYVDKTPLSEALPNSKYLGDIQVEGRLQHQFLFENVLVGIVKQSLVYSLVDDSIFPASVVSYADEAARLANRQSWRWETTEHGRIQNRDVPIKSRFEVFNLKDPSQKSAIDIFTMQNLAFDHSYLSSTFVPKIDPGTEVVDAIKGKQISPATNKVAASTTKVVEPIRVPPASDGSSLVVVGCIGFGLLAIVVGLILRRQRS